MKEIVQQQIPYLLGTLPYRTAVLGGSYADLPGNLRHKLTFEVAKDSFDDTPLSLTKSLPQLAGKKITLSYVPATPEDEAVIDSYLPEPHPDGTPIEPEELPDSLPAYLIKLMPELRIDGQVAASGTAIGAGTTEAFSMSFYDPSLSESPIINPIEAGVYLAIGINLGRITQEQINTLKVKMEATRAQLEVQEYTGLTKEEIFGDLLHITALFYHARLGQTNSIIAKTHGVRSMMLPSETVVCSAIEVDTVFGMPRSVSPRGLVMDADRLLFVVRALDGDNNKAKRFMLTLGVNSSALEHRVPEQLFSSVDDPAEGISAAKALKIANDGEIPIYTIDQSNIATILTQLQIAPLAKADIQNAVNAGKVVTVSTNNIDFNGWIGCGYIIIDPDTGAGAYMISGGVSGSETKSISIANLQPFFSWLKGVPWGRVLGTIGLSLLGVFIGFLTMIVVPLFIVEVIAAASAAVTVGSLLIIVHGIGLVFFMIAVAILIIALIHKIETACLLDYRRRWRRFSEMLALQKRSVRECTVLS
jgi:hypothetical protein